MSGTIKCRECNKAVGGLPRVVVPAMKIASICIECVSQMQRQNGTPTLMTDWVKWYVQQNRSEETKLIARIIELEELVYRMNQER